MGKLQIQETVSLYSKSVPK